MAYRVFRDERGITWSVWETLPGGASPGAWSPEGGWLTFQCELGKLRLAPVPPGWHAADDDGLRAMLRQAENGMRAPDDEAKPPAREERELA